MKTITVDLYEFDELDNEAREFAIKSLRPQAVECMSEADWKDANETMEVVQMKAGVRCWVEESSQGFYLRSAFSMDRCFKDQEEEMREFDSFLYKMSKWSGMTWADELVTSICATAKFDKQRSYEANVGRILVKFCEEVSLQTFSYYNEESVIEWIGIQSFDFMADGKVFNP